MPSVQPELAVTARSISLTRVLPMRTPIRAPGIDRHSPETRRKHLLAITYNDYTYTITRSSFNIRRPPWKGHITPVNKLLKSMGVGREAYKHVRLQFDNSIACSIYFKLSSSFIRLSAEQGSTDKSRVLIIIRPYEGVGRPRLVSQGVYRVPTE